MISNRELYLEMQEAESHQARLEERRAHIQAILFIRQISYDTPIKETNSNNNLNQLNNGNQRNQQW